MHAMEHCCFKADMLFHHCVKLCFCSLLTHFFSVPGADAISTLCCHVNVLSPLSMGAYMCL